MPKPFKDKKQTRYFNAFKFKDQDEKAPKLGVLSEEVMSYYRQVSTTLESGFDDDDPSVKGEFLNNVFLALKDEGIQVAQNQTVSRILEVLFTHSTPGHLQALFEQFCKELTVVTFDRFASHVFEALIQYLPFMYDDNEERVQLKASLDKLCQFTESHLRDIMTHTYGSHALRSLLEVLSGVLVKGEVKQSCLARKLSSGRERVTSVALSEDYKSWFTTLKDKIIRLCNYEDHLIDLNYCPVLQTVLLILHKVAPSEYSTLASSLMDKICKSVDTSSDEGDVCKRLPWLVQHEVGSYLMEMLLSLASESELKDIHRDVFKGNIIYFSVHPIANYVLQKLLTSALDKDTFLELLDETTKYLEDVLAVNHVGIVTKAVEACKDRRLGQDKIFMALRSAFHCDDPKERQLKVVPLIASMQTYDIMFPPPEKQTKTSGLFNSVIIHGSLILQQLVCFDNPKMVASSLVELSPAELSFLCCDKSGSHVVDAFFNSPTVREKAREEFLKKLQGMYVRVACHRIGSRCLENIWKNSSLKRRTFIAEQLLEGQDRIESDQWGHFLYKNFALFKFSQRRKEWIEIQNGIFKKQQILQDILEGTTGKSRKNKKMKRSQHREQEQEQEPLAESPAQAPPATDKEVAVSHPEVEEETADMKRSSKQAKKRKASDMAQTQNAEESNTKKKKKKKKKENQGPPEKDVVSQSSPVEDVIERQSDENEEKVKKRKRKKKKEKKIRKGGGDGSIESD